MNIETVLVSVLLIGLFAVLLIVGVNFHRRLIREHFEKIKLIFEEAKMKSFISGYNITGKYKGRDVKIELRMGSGQRSTYYNIYITLFTETPFYLAIYRQGFLYQLGKTLGLIKSVLNSNSEFEKKYMIRSGQEIIARQFLMNKSYREIFEKILQNGYNSVTIKDGTLLVGAMILTNRKLKIVLDPEIIRGLIEELNRLAEALRGCKKGLD